MSAILDLRLSVKRAFEYLEQEFEFTLSHESPHHVTYSSVTVQLDISLDALKSYELLLTIRRRDGLASEQKEPPFSLAELLRTSHAPEADRFACVQVTTQSALEMFVGEMALLLRRHGADILCGNPSGFHALAQNREAECLAYEDATSLNRARGMANGRVLFDVEKRSARFPAAQS